MECQVLKCHEFLWSFQEAELVDVSIRNRVTSRIAWNARTDPPKAVSSVTKWTGRWIMKASGVMRLFFLPAFILHGYLTGFHLMLCYERPVGRNTPAFHRLHDIIISGIVNSIWWKPAIYHMHKKRKFFLSVSYDVSIVKMIRSFVAQLKVIIVTNCRYAEGVSATLRLPHEISFQFRTFQISRL